jgi:hypothetical protein
MSAQRGVNEFIANCSHFMSDWGEILAGDLHVMLFGIAFRQSVRREGSTFVMGVRAVHGHVRHSDSQSVRHVADGAVCSCRLPQSIQTVPAVHTMGSRGSSPDVKRPGREANHSPT